MITDRDGKPANADDCDYYYFWHEGNQYRNCKTHGHGNIVIAQWNPSDERKINVEIEK